VVVHALARHLAVRKQSTRVVIANSDARRGHHARYRHWGGTVSGCPVPELAFVIFRPALYRSVRLHGTRVVVAQSDARRGRDAIHINQG
jgi:hypothetical protein